MAEVPSLACRPDAATGAAIDCVNLTRDVIAALLREQGAVDQAFAIISGCSQQIATGVVVFAGFGITYAICTKMSGAARAAKAHATLTEQEARLDDIRQRIQRISERLKNVLKVKTENVYSVMQGRDCFSDRRLLEMHKDCWRLADIVRGELEDEGEWSFWSGQEALEVDLKNLVDAITNLHKQAVNSSRVSADVCEKHGVTTEDDKHCEEEDIRTARRMLSTALCLG